MYADRYIHALYELYELVRLAPHATVFDYRIDGMDA